ncbi:ABC transporter substrate-binding protein [Actinospica durhamensis]|uniref:ABC transporter substrate-binding protein n=1 Tax=Actinospica durhamensis TaxID=1508375 RepID=A0A941EMJ3_9ACTN|nr:ABC transporter substrate-binding protein [Actinospica durhamensis]MBR7833856.1 ABC transporter substrate-binding protein [Actinospica durhamensis]
MHTPDARPGIDRRLLLRSVLATGAALGLSSCAAAKAAGPALAADAALPNTVPTGTSLSIASGLGTTQLELQLSGLLDAIPFHVSSWPNLSAGPDVLAAFRAGSVELAVNAGIPPIEAHNQGYDTRIVAINQTRSPTYVFATKPHSTIESVSDFRGKSLAFSQGQAQGVVLLRALDQAGISYKDVNLVNLTSDQFLVALEAGQVDIAPLAVSQLPNYLNSYGKDGAHSIDTTVVDFLTLLWAPAAVLEDADKAAAVAAFVPLWAKATVWVYEHPQDWEQDYYVKTQNISAAQAARVVQLTPKPWFPTSWDAAIAWEKQTVDLLAQGGFIKSFDASVLFDRRFEHLASAAVAATYRS